MTNNIRQRIDEAIDAVANVPDEYRIIAFEVTLQHLLSTSTKPVDGIRKTKNTPINLSAVLNSNFDWSSTNIQSLKPTMQNLYILKIAKDLGMDSLTPQDIQSILYHKFRIAKTPNAVSMSLMHIIGKYIDRIQEGKKFLYKITDKGITYLQSEIQKGSENNEL